MGLFLASIAGADCPSGPVARDDAFDVVGSNPALLDVLANDSQPCGIPLTVSPTVNNLGCAGMVSVSFDHTLVFSPDPGFSGTCTLEYTVIDQEQSSATASVSLTAVAAPPSAAPLRVHPLNPRYFADSEGKAVLLSGAHTWAEFQDYEGDSPFDFEGWSVQLAKLGHNFMRGWVWEDGYYDQPYFPYVSNGDGTWDLETFDQEYFDHLRDRVAFAAERGIYVSIMLFEGWSAYGTNRDRDPDPWAKHPFKSGNNSSNLHLTDPAEVHTNPTETVKGFQKLLIDKYIETFADDPNVIWEICNECDPSADSWQREMADYVAARDGGNHLVWLSPSYGSSAGAPVAESAVITSPEDNNLRFDPPAVSGEKIWISDTDHLGAKFATAVWAWAAFTRGYHMAFMDLGIGLTWYPDLPTNDPDWPLIRAALGTIAKLGNETLDLARMAPQAKTATMPSSTRFSLFSTANPTNPVAQDIEEMLVYVPEDDSTVDLTGLKSGVEYQYQWYYTTRHYDEALCTASACSGEFVATSGASSLSKPALGGSGDGALHIWEVDAPDALSVSAPGDTQSNVGGSAAFSVTATGGSGSYTFTWQSGDSASGPFTTVSGNEFEIVNVGGTSTLTIDPVDGDHGGWYRAVVDDGSNQVESSPALLTLGGDPLAVTAPLDASELEGGVAVFSVTATGGSGNYSFAWQYAEQATGPFDDVDGAEFVISGSGGESILTIDPLAPHHAGFYRAVADDGSSTAISEAAELEVLAACEASHDTIEVPQGIETFFLDSDLFVNDSIPNPVITQWVGPAPDGELIKCQPPGCDPPGFFFTSADGGPIGTGVDSFGYRVRDANNPSCVDDAVVSIDVVPPCMVARDDGPYTVDFPDGEWRIFTMGPLTANDTPSQGVTADIDELPAGTVLWEGPTLIYRPPADYQPTDSFTYWVHPNDDPSCVDTATVHFELAPPEPPQAAFTRSCFGLECTFDASQSTGTGLSYSWNFGDGSWGDGQQVTHTYDAVSSYDVRLVVSDPAGQTSTTQLEVQPIHAGDDLFVGLVWQGITIHWDQLHADDEGPDLLFQAITALPSHGELTEIPSLQAPGPWFYRSTDCSADDSFRYRIFSQSVPYSVAEAVVQLTTLPDEAPEPAFVYSCAGLVCQFTDQTFDPHGYEIVSWSFGDELGSSTEPNPTYTYAAAGTYPVTLTVTDLCQQLRSTTTEVTVHALSVAPPVTAGQVVADGGAVHFQTSATGGVAPYTYGWEFSEEGESEFKDLGVGSVASLTIDPVTPAMAGRYRYRVQDSASTPSEVISEAWTLKVDGSSASILGEVGTVEVGSTPVTVELSRSYVQPVVFALPPGSAELETAVTRLSDVKEDRFTIQIDEAPDHDGVHAQERVSYLVLEAGTWRLPGGERLDVGVVSIDRTVGLSPTSWQSVAFPSPHGVTPVVISQVQSRKDPNWVKTRQDAITASGFSVALEREDAATEPHGEEVLGWLAIEPGGGTWSGHPWGSATTSPVVNHGWYTLDFGSELGASFDPSVHFVAAMQTYRGSDGSALRLRDLDGTSVRVKVEEDTTLDGEIGHITEDVGYVVLGLAGTLRGSANELDVAPPDPSELIVGPGMDARFSVTATGGVQPYSYQWQFSDSASADVFVDLTDGGGISGSGGPTLQIDGVDSSATGWYRCVVTSAASPPTAVTSKPSWLYVKN